MPMEVKQRDLILVVDDQEGNIDIMKHALAPVAEICVAMDGPSAIRAAFDLQPDLILLDVMMPRMDGYEVCRQLKGDPVGATIPIVFITGLEDDLSEVMGLSMGAIDYLVKPLNRELLQARVRNYLALRRSQREIIAQRDQIREAYEKELSLERQKDALSHVIARDMRSPLMAISGHLEMALLDRHECPELKAWENIQTALTNAKRLAEMVTSVLDVRRLESGEISPQRRLCYLDGIVLQAKKELDSLFPGHCIRIGTEQGLVQAFCDPAIMARVMVNLAAVLLRRAPAASEVKMDIRSGPGWHTLSVAGSMRVAPLAGMGLSLADQGSEGGADATLEIAYCRQALAAHNGTLRMEWGPGQGTVIHVDLPDAA